VNLYFQDESRFGLMTHMGRCLTAKGVRPVVGYSHSFESTYLWGSCSPISGDSYTWEIAAANGEVFEKYLEAFSKHRPEEHKVPVIDNAGFHATDKIHVPENISLVRIPPYSPELNPCEQIWQHIKKTFRNKRFKNIQQLKEWLEEQVDGLTPATVKSITSNHRYLEIWNASFNY